ncbi:MAG: TetR/AcrR family transcriptional regulator [Pseudomonadales bacterium]|nr:TetR/AcrR family transcriptional regulator [Pseudomonadales bacterium]MCP5190265.1 TetR/AcrR family transcriptional regulator [Pseudomonadales bacterium]
MAETTEKTTRKSSRGKRKKTNQETVSRGVGRPARLSRAAILAASIELLEEEPVENFTLSRVAKRLDTVSMALYNYFDSREALLCAVADEICMGFKLRRPRAGQAWQRTLRNWLEDVRKLAERHPVILKILGVDGQTTAGWLRVSLTVSRTLYGEGMRGKELAVTSYLFCSQAVALIWFESVGASFHSALSLNHIEELGTDEQDFLLENLRPYHTKLTSDDILNTGFNELIEGLERKLAA